MTGAGAGSRSASPLTTRLLAAILIVLTLLPLLVFATDAPNRAPVRAAREAALARTGAKAEDSDEREERSREARQRRHPPLWGAVTAMLFQLFWICIIALVGRRGFGLRL